MLSLNYPVYTLENKVLLPAGAEISKDTLGELAALGRPLNREICSVLRHDFIRDDLLQFMGIQPYDKIFHDPDEVTEILSLMDTIELPVSLLHSLNYFRQHDFHTYHHIVMVFCLSTVLAKDLLPDYEDQVRLAASGPIHDIGKICVPLKVLAKTTPLTRKERSLLEHHTVAGHVLLAYYLGEQNLPSLVARDHHERNDGSGYPRRIQLNDPLVEIIAVCDVYDALVSPRPYRPVSYENRSALEEVVGMAEEKKVGWDVVKALVARNRGSRFSYGENAISTEKRGFSPPGNVYGIIVEEEEGQEE